MSMLFEVMSGFLTIPRNPLPQLYIISKGAIFIQPNGAEQHLNLIVGDRYEKVFIVVGAEITPKIGKYCKEAIMRGLLDRLFCWLKERHRKRELKLLGDTRRIAEKRIAECLKKTRKKSRRMLLLQLVWIQTMLEQILCWVNLDLANLDLTDDALAELFEAFTAKNKELKFIDCIDLSGNTALTKLPWHIAWCKWLAVLDVTDTGITVLPDWIGDLKLLTVFKGKEIMYDA
jgi:hypothetical protein